MRIGERLYEITYNILGTPVGISTKTTYEAGGKTIVDKLRKPKGFKGKWLDQEEPGFRRVLDDLSELEMIETENEIIIVRRTNDPTTL